jgi:PmbA protein
VSERHQELAQEILEVAQQAGSERVTVSLASTTAFQVEVREGEVESLRESGSSGVHLTLSQGMRRSTLTSNDLRIDSIRPLIRQTLDALEFMGEDDCYVLPEVGLQGRAALDLQVRDPAFEQRPPAEKVQDALDLEARTLRLDERLRSEQAYYSDALSHVVYADSNGFLDGYRKTLFSTGVSLVVEDPGHAGENVGRKQTDGWYDSDRFHERLEDPDILARQASQRVLRKLGAVKPRSCEVPVVFSAEMARSFLGSLAGAMMGESVFRKQSFLAERLQTVIAHSSVSLRDDPLLPGKLGSRYYDSEGVQARPLPLIEQGRLEHFMLSTYSAKKLGMQTTGHSGGYSNLILEPGPYTEEELIASVPEGLYLTFMSGQGANIVTGDYSRGAQGLWIRNGKLEEAVSEFTIASTYLEMLRQISMIACEVDDRSSVLSPAFKIDRMSISGT